MRHIPRAASIGIIGGADGPTAIYVTHKISRRAFIAGAVALAAAAVAVMIHFGKK